MTRMVQVSAALEVTPKMIAEMFAELNDEEQADVFIELAKIANGWPSGTYQFHLVGRHLRNCECSTEEARDLVRELAQGLDAPPAPMTGEGQK